MDQVKALLAKTAETMVSTSGNVLLKSGKQYVTLVKGNTTTKAGNAYRVETQKDPKNIMDGVSSYKRGRTEYMDTLRQDMGTKRCESGTS